jgi:hypothetical protein
MNAADKIEAALSLLEISRRLLWDVDEGKTDDKRFSIPDNDYQPAEFWHSTHGAVTDAIATINSFRAVHGLDGRVNTDYARWYLTRRENLSDRTVSP